MNESKDSVTADEDLEVFRKFAVMVGMKHAMQFVFGITPQQVIMIASGNIDHVVTPENIFETSGKSDADFLNHILASVNKPSREWENAEKVQVVKESISSRYSDVFRDCLFTLVQKRLRDHMKDNR